MYTLISNYKASTYVEYHDHLSFVYYKAIVLKCHGSQPVVYVF